MQKISQLLQNKMALLAIGGAVLVASVAIWGVWRFVAPNMPGANQDDTTQTARTEHSTPSGGESTDTPTANGDKPAEEKPADQKPSGSTQKPGSSSGGGGSTGGSSGGGTGGTGGTGGGTGGGGGDTGGGTPTVWPSASNTGVAGCPALTTQNGSVTLGNNQTLENKIVNGQVRITGNNVTVRCVKVVDGGLFPIDAERGGYTSASNVLIERVEVDCQSSAGTHAGLLLFGATARKVNVHHCTDGFRFADKVTIEDSYCHDLNTNDPNDPHYDCAQTSGGGQLIIRRNLFVGRDTSNILIKSDLAPINDVLIENNKFLGTPGYHVYSVSGGHGTPTNVRFLNNRFGRSFGWGPCSVNAPAPVWQGNVWDDNSAAIPMNCVD